MNKKTALAFDFDGTLASSFTLEDDVMSKACQAVGFDVTPEEIHSHYGPTESGIIRDIVGDDRFDEAWKVCIGLYKEGSRKLKPYDGIPELLNLLASHKVLVVLLTGRSRTTLDISLKDFGLENDFVRCYVGSETGENKQYSIVQVMKDYGLEPKDVLYIGDTLADIRMMRSVNIDILSAGYSHPRDYQALLEEQNPGNVMTSVDELKERLLNLI